MIENRSASLLEFSWKSNTESICKKITSAISVIRKLKEFVDREHLFLYLMQLYNHTLLIVVKCGTFLVKLNHNDYKSFKIDALELLRTWVMKLMLKLH
jgi:hypothetical protein